MIHKAIIPVAGKGTRMQPITNVTAKEMLPIGTTPTLEYVVREAVDSGIQQILFVISPTKGTVAKYFAGTYKPKLYEDGGRYLYDCGGKSVEIYFTYQGGMVGSGGAILYGRDFAQGEGVAVLFGDDIIVGKTPATKQLLEMSHRYHDASVLGVQHQAEHILRTCGVIDIKQDMGDCGVVADIIEKPQGDFTSDLASLGRFILSADCFAVLADTPPKNGEIWLTDALAIEAHQSNVYYKCFEGKRYDIGNRYGYIRAFCDLAVGEDEMEDYQRYKKNC